MFTLTLLRTTVKNLENGTAKATPSKIFLKRLNRSHGNYLHQLPTCPLHCKETWFEYTRLLQIIRVHTVRALAPKNLIDAAALFNL
jgi:hypothetical protein